jgi:hypothetical protein
MTLTYSTYVSSLANMLIVAVTDPGFQAMIPNCLDDAELFLQRRLDLVDSTVRDTSATFTLSTRNFSLPTTLGTFIVVDQMNVITPAGITNAENGTRHSLIPASIDTLDALWPSSSGSTIPVYFAMMNQDLAIVGPWPDQTYNIEVVGTQRFTPLYVSQTTSPLSVFFPDLLLAWSLVFASGYQRNFGSMADDPKMAMSWKAHADGMLADAITEENKKKGLIGHNAMPMPKAGG